MSHLKSISDWNVLWYRLHAGWSQLHVCLTTINNNTKYKVRLSYHTCRWTPPDLVKTIHLWYTFLMIFYKFNSSTQISLPRLSACKMISFLFIQNCFDCSNRHRKYVFCELGNHGSLSSDVQTKNFTWCANTV